MDVIRDTLAWHTAVAEAKAERFGEQDPAERIGLSIKLIQEETAELIAELQVLQASLSGERPSMEIILDALMNAGKEASDIFFVVLQALHAVGYTPERFAAVYAEVVRSNYSKLDGGVAKFRDDGKLLKGPAYSKADVMKALQEADGVS